MTPQGDQKKSSKDTAVEKCQKSREKWDHPIGQLSGDPKINV
ncbi:MAG: hypothetical protein AB4352_03715 [Hormoscilla sp.]